MPIRIIHTLMAKKRNNVDYVPPFIGKFAMTACKKKIIKIKEKILAADC